MTNGNLIRFICLLFLTAAHAAEAATPALSDQAEAYIRQQLKPQLDENVQLHISLRQPSARLQLDPCQAPVQFSSSRPLTAGSITLKASCDYPRRWSRYLRGEIKLMREILLSTRPLRKGHQLQAADLRPTLQNQTDLRDGFFTDPQQIIGHQLNRGLAANRPLTPRLLAPPVLIDQGDTVTIQAGSGGINVEMSGVALEPGRQGQQISVKNSRSGRIIKARVTDRGTVKISR